ncbi:MAG TPA: HAD-IA family hydrolase [Armatimonadota bacterium]|jgi:pyrophosphatase PpaX
MTYLFDLDGTLLDSTELLLEGYKHTARMHLGRETPDEEWLEHFGKPLRDQMALFDEDQADEMVCTYRAFYDVHHDDLIRIYEGIPDILKTLHEQGHKLGVVTSKLTKFSHRALEWFDIDRYLDVVIGEDLVSAHKPDPAAVILALKELCSEANGAWMIGDSPYDIQAGQGAGCRTAAVLWGPFNRETLAPYNPTVFLEDPREMLGLG